MKGLTAMKPGIADMAGEVHELSSRIGALEARVEMLTQTVRDNQEASTTEHRKVHDIVSATAEAVRNVARTIGEMKPLTDDYREKRAEGRGKMHVINMIYVTLGGIAGAICARVIEMVPFKVH